ncbi:universal stress protein [Halorussus amylolyticus]|uniref:universal stress protein n=1 Tax=Halorussus amylolyticus TaxID=1126242 RepID=UPI001052D197|nr:universal stress protein [Halorussus amylolyticus]
MSSRILVPIDGSEESRLALDHALAQFPGAHIILLHVIEPFPDHTKAGGHTGGRAKQVFEKGQHLLDEMVERENEYTGTVTTELIYGRPVHAIPRYVETHGIDEIVIGSHGHDGTARLLLGSVAETVVRRAPTPVTVVRPIDKGVKDGYHPPEHVAVPFDRSFCSRNALEYAFEQFPDATVTALFVKSPLFEAYEPIESEDDLNDVLADGEETENETHDVFEMARQIAEQHERGVETATEEGDPSRGILGWLDENDVDHVVIGCHGRDGVARWVLGSVAETVVRRTPVPVTAIK